MRHCDPMRHVLRRASRWHQRYLELIATLFPPIKGP